LPAFLLMLVAGCKMLDHSDVAIVG